MGAEDIHTIKVLAEIAIIIGGIGMFVQKILGNINALREDITDMRRQFMEETAAVREISAVHYRHVMEKLRILEERQTRTEKDVGRIISRIDNGFRGISDE